MTSAIGPASQYATAKPFMDKIGSANSNLSGSNDDSDRVRAYSLYEDFYYNRPESFEVLLRGEATDPVYIPSAKKIVEAMNRFLCKGFAFVVPASGDQRLSKDEAELQRHMNNLFKREKMYSKFNSQKRLGLIRGDAMFYITADPNKPEGKKISIHELNPGNYFPIMDPNDKNRVIGCHIVDVVHDPREKEDKSKTICRRSTYLKGGVSFNAANSQYEQTDVAAEGIWYEVSHWTIGKWDDRNLKAADLERVTTSNDVEMMQLPSPINSLPVYHWRNVVVPDSQFGNSEISGIETLIQGINQDISDTQLTLVLQGLGIYATDSKPPVNAAGETTNWELGPGSVVERAQGTSFERITGVGSVQPALELIEKLQNSAQEANGIPDIAAGKVDVTVAESGISLALQLMPILASGKEKEGEILGTTDQFLYDLQNMWFPAYEGISFNPEVQCVSIVDDPMPVNRDTKIQEIMLLFSAGLITIAAAQAELAKLGYKFAANDDKQVLLDAALMAQAQGGDMDNRYAEELNAPRRELTPGAGDSPDGLVGGDTAGLTDPSTGEPASMAQEAGVV